MRITLVAVGRLREPYWRDAAAEYLKRLGPYAAVRVVEIEDRDVTRDERRAVAAEGADVLRALPERAHVAALTLDGRRLSSEDFSAELERRLLHGQAHMAFVLGGAAGLSPDVIARADERLSLGPLTLPHQLARIVLLEQLYRSFRIIRGEPYHR